MPSAAALAILQSALGVELRSLEAAFDAAAAGDYRRWRAPKPAGGFRQLASPAPALKAVQRAALEQLFSRVGVSPFAHGFVPGRSIVSNALVHAETAKAMLSVDLRDAFPSVSRKRVRDTIEWRLGPLLKPDFAAPASVLGEVYDLLADLCTDRNSLPQGAPTSGILLNLVCARLDRLVYRVLRRGASTTMRYSRYADDLTISDSQALSDAFVDQIKHAVVQAGFRLNLAKLERVSAREKDLLICGVRLHNGQPALPRKVLHRYRALFHTVQAMPEHHVSPELRQRVYGVLGLLRMIYPCCPVQLSDPLRRLMARHKSWLKPPLPEPYPTAAMYRFLQ